MIKHTLAALCLSSIATSTAFAAVSAEEAARLGKDLTPMGAEMAGNDDIIGKPAFPDTHQLFN